MGMIERRIRQKTKTAARPTRIVAEVRLGSVVWLLSMKVEELYIRRARLLTHYATERRRAHLTKSYSPKCLEEEFCELRL